MKNSPLVIFHLDLKVAQFKREYLKALFSRLRHAGYTHICFEIEDKVRLDTCPEAAWVEAYAKEEFAEILSDARAAGLGPFPLVQTLGHLEYVLRHARFAPLREDPLGHGQICPSNRDAMKFVRDLCAEVHELFDNPGLFHIGGDEARSLGKCPQCAARVQAGSVSRLYLEHMRAVCEPLIAAGTRPIVWADMALAHPEALQEMPNEVVFCDWDYFNGDDVPHFLPFWANARGRRAAPSDPDTISPAFMKRYGEFLYPDGTDKPPALWFFADYLRAQGHDVIVAPATRCVGDNMFFPAASHVPNCVGACVKALIDRQAMGVMVTSWAVRLNHLETQWSSIVIPGIVASTGKRHRADILDPVAEMVGFEDGHALWRIGGTLGAALPFSQSCGTVFAEIYGMRHGFADEVRRFFADKISSNAAHEKVERQLEAYNAIEALLDAQCENKRHWLAALHSMRQKAHQFLALARLHHDKRLSKRDLSAVEHELASVWDETAACLEDSYTPATLNRELAMRFGAEWRYFTSDDAVKTLLEN